MGSIFALQVANSGHIIDFRQFQGSHDTKPEKSLSLNPQNMPGIPW